MRTIQPSIYFGHPYQFWRERLRYGKESLVNAEELKKLTDVVDYDTVHLNKANGMCYTKEDQIRLKIMQKKQIEDRKCMDMAERELENMWHQVLVQNVRHQELQERVEAERRKQAMLERRKIYDEQIASANKQRQEILQYEREQENKRLEKIKKRIEEDHYTEMKRKKEQQITNKNNFLEGHAMKFTRIRQEKTKERAIDNGAIREALSDLRRERELKKMQMQKLQTEKEVFVEYFNRERKMAQSLEEDADRVLQDWINEENDRTVQHFTNVQNENRMDKKKAAEGYREHIKERNLRLERERREHHEAMECVRRRAIEELQKKLDSANSELRRQIEYRNYLDEQIRENQKIAEKEIISIENKQKPFTKKAEMFKDAMMYKVDKSPGRLSTNPVHPFRKAMENMINRYEENQAVQLPLIGQRIVSKYYQN